MQLKSIKPPKINCKIAVLKIPKLNSYLHNKDIVPAPGIVILSKKRLKSKI